MFLSFVQLFLFIFRLIPPTFLLKLVPLLLIIFSVFCSLSLSLRYYIYLAGPHGL